MPPLVFWQVLIWVGYISTACAIIGFITRPMMIISVISVLFFVLLKISESYFWSHTWNVLFYAAIPFAFCAAGSGLSVDRLLVRRFSGYWFGQRNEPVLWGILGAQAGVALFVFGAFYAKIFHGFELAGPLGPIHYTFSDNMRNVLGVFWLGVPENVAPPWIVWAWSTPFVWKLLMLGHLVMQAAPAASFFSLHKPVWRLLEGLIFFAGIIALGVVANGWNNPWMLLIACFIDWDYFLGRRETADRPTYSRLGVTGVATVLGAFFAPFIVGVATQTANSWGMYPYSNLEFYAGMYVRAPYDEHLPYADYDIGEVTVHPGPGFDPTIEEVNQHCNATGKGWTELRRVNWYQCFRMEDGQMQFPYWGNDLHGIGREQNLDRLEGSLRYWSEVPDLSGMPPGTRYIAWRKTAGFPPYPEPMAKTTLHAGVRGIYDPDTDDFAGLSSTMDRDARLITIADIRGETSSPSERLVFARFNTHLNRDPLPRILVPGEWIDDSTFEISEAFMQEHRGKLFNSFITTETIFGVVDFDGPIEWW